EVGASPGCTGVCDLFQLFRGVRYYSPAILLGALSADVSRRFPVRLPLFIRESLVKIQCRQFTRAGHNSCVTNRNSRVRDSAMLRPLAVIISVISATSAFATATLDTSNQMIISIRDQKLVLLRNGSQLATYPISTSMFGLGDAWGRMTTPLGYLAVEKKIGDNVPIGAVFHNRRLTGEILQPNAPGRDPVTTRIIWLRGLEAQNSHAFKRCIYIHGTPEEKKIGRPASYGCIRMKSSDVAALYDRVPLGTLVQITPERLPKVVKPPRSQPANALVTANAKPQNQEQIVSAQTSEATLSVDQMRLGGSVAAQRQKAKLELNKRL